MTRLGARVSIEPLDPERVTRIENGVLAAYRAIDKRPLRRRPQLVRLSLAGAALAAVALAAWIGLRARPHGERLVVPENGAPARIATGAGPSRIDIGDAVITAAADTVLEIRRAGGGVEVALERGAVGCEVEPRHHRPPFVVRAGKVDVTVVGTVFSVARTPEVTVRVTRGKVRVDAAGATAFVAAGQAWADGKVELASAAAEPHRSSAGDGAVDPDHAGATAHDNEVASPRTPDEQPKLHRHVTRAPKPHEPARSQRVFAGGVAARPAPAAAPDDRPVAELERAQLESKGGDREIVYSLARQQFTARNAAAALRQIDYFTVRFQGGKYYKDALELRILILCKNQPSSACREAAHAYLSAFPDGSYRDDARALTNWM